MLGTNSMKTAPKIAPEIEATPPTTMPTRKLIDRKIGKLSGATNCIDDRAERAGDAGVHRADAEGGGLVAARC